MAELDQGPTNILDSSYGSLLIGLAFAIFFQGTLTVQAYNYYNNFPKDRMRIKVTVATVCILDTVHLILMFKGTYGFVITNWGFIASLKVVPVVFDLHLILTGMSVLVTQAFYLERIWVFSDKNIFVVGPIVMTAIVPLVLDFYMGALCIIDTLVNEYWRTKPEATAMFVSGAAADMLIAVVTWYYLSREKSSFESTRNIVTKAIQMVVATGFSTALIAIIATIAFFVQGDALYFIAIHMQLGRVYSNSLLASLNARQRNREMAFYMGDRQSFGATNSGSTGQYDSSINPQGAVVRIVKQTHTDQVDFTDRSPNASMGNLAFEKLSGNIA